MKIKICTCGKPITTKNVARLIRSWEGSINKSILWIDCANCGSTGCNTAPIKDRSKMKFPKIIKQRKEA